MKAWTSPKDRRTTDLLDWLLNFVQAEFGTPKGPEVVKLRHNLVELLGPVIEGPPFHAIRTLHGTLSRKLRKLKDGEPWSVGMDAKRTLHLEGLGVTSETRFEPAHEAQRALVAAMTALLAVQDRLRLCPNDRKLFLRRGRQRYCSKRCQDTAAKRRYRQGKRGHRDDQHGNHAHDAHTQ